jgi:hypothetical protein
VQSIAECGADPKDLFGTGADSGQIRHKRTDTAILPGTKYKSASKKELTASGFHEIRPVSRTRVYGFKGTKIRFCSLDQYFLLLF